MNYPDFKFYRDSVHPNLNYNYFVVHDALLIAGSKQYYLVDKTGINAHTYVDGTQVFGFNGTNMPENYTYFRSLIALR